MKKILLFCISLVYLSGYSQQRGDITIEWVDKATTSNGTSTFTIPQFNKENFAFDAISRQISYNIKLPLSAPASSRSLQITNTVYEPISAAAIGDLSPQGFPSAINATLTAITARDLFYGLLQLSPIIKDNTGYRKLKSFSYSFDSDSGARMRRSANVSAVTSSNLATGDWYRFYVEKSGVYKISKGFLQSLGFNTDGDPRNIKIYGNGGRMLPLMNSEPYPDDLAENAIYFQGEQDGQFDGSDYILFYAEGVDTWNDESQTHNNLYATKSYYYVTSKGGAGKRINDMVQPSGGTSVSVFEDYQYHEKDLVNIARLGRKWFGEQFSVDNEHEFEFKFPGVVSSEPASLKIYAAASSFTSTSFNVESNGQAAGTMTMGALSAGSDVEARANILSANIGASETLKIKMTYNNNGVPGSRGYLDYIIVKAKRALKGYGKQYRFEYDGSASTGAVQFNITGATSIPQVWDVTDIYNVTKAANAGQGSFSFSAGLGDIRKYVVLDNADYYSPLKEGQPKVVNQDLKGTIFKNAQGVFQDVEYLILVPAFLNAPAEKLANFHRTYSGMNVKVVHLEKIYPEFGSGKQDIAAIRNFIKYVYENPSDDTRRIKYVNLFGDGSFDHRDIVDNNTNIFPAYHSGNSFAAGETCFVSDDFFVLMDDDEGRMEYYHEASANNSFFDTTTYNLGGVDIAVGRMVVTTVKEADDMVTKVIDYHDYKSYGSWRNNYVLIADDADKSSDASLQVKQNQLAQTISLYKPFINIKKIFLDSYVQETAAGGDRYPVARDELFGAFEKGALVFNYLGHGGEDGLSLERIWEKIDGQSLSNRYKYPLFITITCEFSRFDNPFRPTAGEYTYWNPTGGAIGMITTVRSIFQGPAEAFNDKLSQYLLSYVNNSSSNTYTSIAEALRLAKNASSNNSSSNVVFYIGDPAMSLAIPKPMVRLTKVNGAPVTGPIDDLQSLGFVTLTGEVTDENNTPLSSYNGELAVNIFDKEITRSTFNNDGNAPPYVFNILGETIFRGNASISNGQFEFSFVVPRDIRI
ncbi:MAG TPA: type IX secretion system sortase PorU, partial [Flavobacterium sp.]|nr:type IX secretion system sortase PorU [Flavobacterium sp.]